MQWKNVVLSTIAAAGMLALSNPALAQDQSQTQASRAPHVSRNTVRQVQQQLKNEGFYQGKIDGIDGPQTQAAIREYQRKQNLAVNGRLDQQTRDKLGIQTTGEAARSATGGTESVPPAKIKAAQQHLKQMGFYKGEVNGQMNAETEAAIREYQKSANLNATGQLDKETLSKLGVSK